MWNLYLGIVLIAGLGVGVAFLAAWWSQSWSSRTCDVAAVVTVLLLCAYLAWLWDHPLLAHVVPFSNLIVVVNWFPLFAGFLGGLIWRRTAARPWSRGAIVGVIAVISFYALVRPLGGTPVECEAKWSGKMCLQTSASSCSAASAATVLKGHGIEATEAEMAELCLTRVGGTHWMGLYRGLRKRTAGTEWTVRPFRGDVDGLEVIDDLPAILFVRLEEKGFVDPAYEAEGWLPGVDHSVVFFRVRDESYEMGDPANGIERWSRRDMEALWHGRGMRFTTR